MKIFVADGSNKQRQYCKNNNIGLLSSPSYFRMPLKDVDYILDNGAFIAWKNGKDWDEVAFYNTIDILLNNSISPYFVVIPDIVAGGLESLNHSIKHIFKIPNNIKKYLPVQDGMEIENISKEILIDIDGIFVGGSVVWKWKNAKKWIDFGHDHNLKCHIGRVGTKKDYIKAHHMGADSVDGSGPMRNQKLYIIPEFYKWITEQKEIFDYKDYRYNNLYYGLFGDW